MINQHAYLRGQLTFAILCQIIFLLFQDLLIGCRAPKKLESRGAPSGKILLAYRWFMPWRFSILRLSPSCFLVHLQRSDEKWKALKAENRYLVTQPRALLSLHNTKPHHNPLSVSRNQFNFVELTENQIAVCIS